MHHKVDCDDEVKMVRLCEALWPGELTSQLRAAVEAELQAREPSGPHQEPADA